MQINHTDKTKKLLTTDSRGPHLTTRVSNL